MMASEEIEQKNVIEEESHEVLTDKPRQSRKRNVKRELNKILLKGDGESKKPPGVNE